MKLKTLRLGSKGKLVKKWQNFLRGLDFYRGKTDGHFGNQTQAATEMFQFYSNGVVLILHDDGVVGPRTYAKAMLLGFDPVQDTSNDKSGPNWPSKPILKPLVGTSARQRIFGKFKYKSAPSKSNPEGIKVLDGWQKKNVVMVKIPQLVGIYGTGKLTKFPFHRLIATRVQELFQAWDDEGLIHLINSWGGSYNPRFIRGSRTVLSNHSFATAFDINVPWNMLGAQPAMVGKKGSIRELVPIANELGFYWGGHFKRRDGMHFEATKSAIVE
mgnify:FL=1